MRPIHEALASLAEQHDGLKAELDALTSQLFAIEQREAVAEGLRNLLMGIGMHFGFEEALMEEWLYPAIEHHRRQHFSLMTELGMMLDRVEIASNAFAMSRELDLLADWYRQHVAYSDQALEKWLRTVA